MLAAIITLSLLSLLIATEVDHTGSPIEPTPGEPCRPKNKVPSEQESAKSDRLAA
jgi:hypothetical protein